MLQGLILLPVVVGVERWKIKNITRNIRYFYLEDIVMLGSCKMQLKSSKIVQDTRNNHYKISISCCVIFNKWSISHSPKIIIIYILYIYIERNLFKYIDVILIIWIHLYYYIHIMPHIFIYARNFCISKKRCAAKQCLIWHTELCEYGI